MSKTSKRLNPFGKVGNLLNPSQGLVNDPKGTFAPLGDPLGLFPNNARKDRPSAAELALQRSQLLELDKTNRLLNQRRVGLLRAASGRSSLLSGDARGIVAGVDRATSGSSASAGNPLRRAQRGRGGAGGLFGGFGVGSEGGGFIAR